MARSGKQLDVNVAVHFKAEGADLKGYLDQVQKAIDEMRSNTKNDNYFSKTEKDIQKTIAEFDKLSNFKLNSNNQIQFANQVDKLNNSISQLRTTFSKENEDLTKRESKYTSQITKANEWISEHQKEIDIIREKVKNQQTLTTEEAEINKQYISRLGLIGRMNKALEKAGLSEEDRKKVVAQLTGLEDQLAAAMRGVADAEKEQSENEDILNKQNTINAVKEKIKYYTSFAFSIQLVRRQMRQAIDTFKEVDKSITSISMVSGISRETLWGNIGQYNDLAQELGTTTQSVLEASQLYYQQGRNTLEVVNLTRESLTLAAIAELETADATNYLTAAVNGYKMEASEAGEVTDVWAQLAAKNAVSVKELAVSISKVASIAQSAGMDIQSTSAFLTQMIATTREAPENLGTALKTIIARFQELKTSSAALEDGVDANKVEKALKTVGISLRDATGQFRDFDDVILELSSKWDSLDRNTQRYIATIAAGSRQQSRFIALVSDYEGLTEIMQQAEEAQGAAASQFEVYSSGLEAALKRVKAAWENFYLSFAKGQSMVISVAKLLTKILNGASKLGAGTTVALGLVTAALIRISLAAITTGKGFSFLSGKTLGAKISMLAYAAATGKAADAQILLEATNPVGWIGIVAGLLVSLIPLLTKGNDKLEKAKEHVAGLREEAQELKQSSDQLNNYANSLIKASLAGEDTVEIRQNIIDLQHESLKNLPIETMNYYQLAKAMREAADADMRKSILDNIQAIKESANIDIEEEKDKFKNQYKDQPGGWHAAVEDRATESEMSHLKELGDGTEDQVYEYENILDRIVTDTVKASQQTKLAWSDARFIAKDIFGDIPDEELQSIAGFIRDIGEEAYQYDDALEVFTSDAKEDLLALYNLGNLDSFKIGDLEQAAKEARNAGHTVAASYIEGYIAAAQEQAARVQEILDGFSTKMPNYSEGNTDSLRGQAMQTFEQLGGMGSAAGRSFMENFGTAFDEGDTETQQKVINWANTLIESVGAENIDSNMMNLIFGRPEDMENAYQQQAQLLADGKVHVTDYGEAIKSQLDDSTAAWLEFNSVISETGSIMSDVEALAAGGLSLDELSAKIMSLSENYQQMGYESQAAAIQALYLAASSDSSGYSIDTESEAIQNLIGWIDTSTEESRQNSLERVNDAMEKNRARYAELESEKTLVEGQINGTAAEVDATAEGYATNVKNANEAGKKIQTIVDRIKGFFTALGVDTSGWTGAWEDVEWTATENKVVEAAEARLAEIADEQAALNDEYKTLSDIWGRLQVFDPKAGSKARDVGSSSGSKGSDGKSSTSKESEQTKALKELLAVVKDANKELQALAKMESQYARDAIKDLKDKAKEQQKILEKDLENRRRQNKMYFDYVKEQLQKQLKDFEKNIKKQEEALELNADAAKKYYQEKIDATQADIDALNEEAEAEDRLRKLQEARDAYERARSQKTRLVLTQGAGWIFKTDTDELNSARDGLRAAERDYQKAVLQDEIDANQKIIDLIEKQIEEREKSTAQLEKEKEAYEGIVAMLEGENAVGIEGVLDMLKNDTTELQKDRTVYEFHLDEEQEGSITNLINHIDTLIERIGWDQQDYEDYARMYGEDGEGGWAKDIRDHLPASIESSLNSDDWQNSFKDKIDGYFDPRFTRFEDYQKNAIKEIDAITNEDNGLLKKLDDIDKMWQEEAKYIGKTTKEIDEENRIRAKYEKATLDNFVQYLGPNGSLYTEFKNMIFGENGTVQYADYEKYLEDQVKISEAADKGETLAPTVPAPVAINADLGDQVATTSTTPTISVSLPTLGQNTGGGTTTITDNSIKIGSIEVFGDSAEQLRKALQNIAITT